MWEPPDGQVKKRTGAFSRVFGLEEPRAKMRVKTPEQPVETAGVIKRSFEKVFRKGSRG